MTEEIEVRRAGRDDLAAIAALVRRATRARIKLAETDVMEWLFSKGLWVVIQGDSLLGVAAWQAENLLSVTDVFYVSPVRTLTMAGTRLLESIEAEAGVLMCEANVMLLPSWTSKSVRTFLRRRGYVSQEFGELHRIWREVLGELDAEGMDLMVKRLRDRMVMVPI